MKTLIDFISDMMVAKVKPAFYAGFKLMDTVENHPFLLAYRVSDSNARTWYVVDTITGYICDSSVVTAGDTITITLEQLYHLIDNDPELWSVLV